MESTAANKYQKLVRMLGAFVGGENRSLLFVREIDAEFCATGLKEDDRFSDLLMTLDLFGVAAKDFGYREKALAIECWYALRLLNEQP